jgi:malic enzyme
MKLTHGTLAEAIEDAMVQAVSEKNAALRYHVEPGNNGGYVVYPSANEKEPGSLYAANAVGSDALSESEASSLDLSDDAEQAAEEVEDLELALAAHE